MGIENNHNHKHRHMPRKEVPNDTSAFSQGKWDYLNGFAYCDYRYADFEKQSCYSEGWHTEQADLQFVEPYYTSFGGAK